MGGLETLTDDINTVDTPWHIILLIANIFVAGSGTIVNSLMGKSGIKKITLLVGLIQFAPLVIWRIWWRLGYILQWVYVAGWVWSVWWGVLIYKKTAK